MADHENDLLPGDRWVNAVITIVVPIDVDPDAEIYAKQEAVGAVMDQLVVPDNAVSSGTAEVRVWDGFESRAEVA